MFFLLSFQPSQPCHCPINSSCPLHVCFCAVCGRVAPWTGPAHCVHLLHCRCSGCLQYHRYSHPEIVSHIHTYVHTRIGWMTQAIRKCDPVACYLGVVLAKLCMFMVARCQRIPGRHRSTLLKCSLSVNPFYQNVPVFSWKAEVQPSSLFLGTICSAAISSGSHVSGRRGCFSILRCFC